MPEKIEVNLEDESPEAKSARKRRRLRRNLQELALAVAFPALVMAADSFSSVSHPQTAISALFVALAVATLALWFAHYVRGHRELDEFERKIDLQALAIAGGGAVLFATSLGVAKLILGAPDILIVMAAPIYSLIYIVTRYFALSAFR